LPPYKLFNGTGVRITGELLEAPPEFVADVVTRIVDCEGPVHEADVMTRIAGLWDTRAGSRIQEAIRRACKLAERQRQVSKRGPFYWRADGTCEPRSREGSGIPGDRIAPEEYVEAIRFVLADGPPLPRTQLVVDVRAAIGYSRTGVVLEQAVGSVVDGLLLGGQVGEGSSGLVWRGPREG
jgi:hypothetical protein